MNEKREGQSLGTENPGAENFGSLSPAKSRHDYDVLRSFYSPLCKVLVTQERLLGITTSISEP